MRGSESELECVADDTLVGFPKKVQAEYLAIKQQYAQIINIGSPGISPVLKFTGVDIERDRERGTITIHQRQYIA